MTARELASASQVKGGTLYTLLRRLTDDGTLEKRGLPGGQTGYALATSAEAAALPAAAQPQDATTGAAPTAEPRASERPERDRADSPQTADAIRSAPGATQPSEQQPTRARAERDYTTDVLPAILALAVRSATTQDRLPRWPRVPY